jgi:hypothetical protein
MLHAGWLGQHPSATTTSSSRQKLAVQTITRQRMQQILLAAACFCRLRTCETCWGQLLLHSKLLLVMVTTPSRRYVLELVHTRQQAMLQWTQQQQQQQLRKECRWQQ